MLHPSEASANDNLGSISAQLKLTTLSKNGVSPLKDLLLQAYVFCKVQMVANNNKNLWNTTIWFYFWVDSMGMGERCQIFG